MWSAAANIDNTLMNSEFDNKSSGGCGNSGGGYRNNSGAGSYFGGYHSKGNGSCGGASA